MAGEKKSSWEKKKIEETWKDCKLFWGMIRELLGKKKNMKRKLMYTQMREKEGR